MKKMTDYRSTGSFFELYDLHSHKKRCSQSLASVLQAARLLEKESVAPVSRVCIVVRSDNPAGRRVSPEVPLLEPKFDGSD